MECERNGVNGENTRKDTEEEKERGGKGEGKEGAMGCDGDENADAELISLSSLSLPSSTPLSACVFVGLNGILSTLVFSPSICPSARSKRGRQRSQPGRGPLPSSF